ncbi:putative reverse transcriptase domain-containing protein [Tanacetum coccineum]
MESVFHISGCAIENQVKFATCTLLGAALTWWNGHVRTLGHDAAYATTWGTFKKKFTDKYCQMVKSRSLKLNYGILSLLMCTKFLADETAKIDKYIGGLPDNIHGNVMFSRPKTLDFAIELANDLMDQKLATYAERQNDNKRKADDSSRNHHQQQHHKKQNVARAYTAGPGKKKVYTGDLPLCIKCNYHYTGQCAPKCENSRELRRHATTDFLGNTNNNNRQQQHKFKGLEYCNECGNTGHMRRECPKLKNREWQREWHSSRRDYSLGEKMLSQTLNVITGSSPGDPQLVGQEKEDHSCMSNQLSSTGEKRRKAAFQLIKQKLCSAPILALPKGSENFIVYCDASHKGLGAVLMQNRESYSLIVLLRTAKLHNDILMFQQHHVESLSKAWTHFKDLLQKVPHQGINLWLQVQIFYDHVYPVTRRTIDQSASDKLRDLNAEESWALLEDLALYDNESWNDPMDFAKPVKAIALP